MEAASAEEVAAGAAVLNPSLSSSTQWKSVGRLALQWRRMVARALAWDAAAEVAPPVAVALS